MGSRVAPLGEGADGRAVKYRDMKQKTQGHEADSESLPSLVSSLQSEEVDVFPMRMVDLRIDNFAQTYGTKYDANSIGAPTATRGWDGSTHHMSSVLRES